MKLLILSILVNLCIFAQEITPYKYITASEAVSDFVKIDDTLVIATEESIIDIYDLKQDKLVDQVVLPLQTNILREEMGILVMSVDYLQGRLVFITRLLNTWGEMYIYEDKKLIKLIQNDEKITLQKVAFVNKDLVIITTMGNELILYDIKNQKYLYRKQLTLSSFSDFALSEDKKHLYTADETPLVYKIEIKTGKIIKKYIKANKRDIFAVDFKNNLLMTGGKDNRVVLYKQPKQYKITKADFFIYAVGLNPNATMAAFDKNEKNDISIIDTQSLKELFLLKGHKQTVIKIDFFSENELLTADEDNRLMFWRLK